MEKKRIVVTSELPGEAFRNLIKDDRFEVKVLSDSERMDLLETVRSFRPQGMVTLLSDRVDEEVLKASADLSVVANYAVGFNNIDTSAAEKLGIAVTNTPGVLTDATADIAFMLLLMTTRRAVPSDRFTREGKFTGWLPSLFLGKSIQEKRLGIVGLGRIGKAVAKRAGAFGMEVCYNNRNRLDGSEERELGVTWVERDELLRSSDVVSLHLPYTPENRHMIGSEQLASMKKSAVLINTARGALVDEKALVRALRDGEIYAAGLDVYENEPKVEKELLSMENVVLLPHTGSATEETRSRMAAMVIGDTVSVLEGKDPENRVV